MHLLRHFLLILENMYVLFFKISVAELLLNYIIHMSRLFRLNIFIGLHHVIKTKLLL
jgi:hypothetical protein